MLCINHCSLVGGTAHDEGDARSVNKDRFPAASPCCSREYCFLSACYRGSGSRSSCPRCRYHSRVGHGVLLGGVAEGLGENLALAWVLVMLMLCVFCVCGTHSSAVGHEFPSPINARLTNLYAHPGIQLTPIITTNTADNSTVQCCAPGGAALQAWLL